MWVIHNPKLCTLQHEKKKKKRVNFQPDEDDAKPRGKPKGLKVAPVLQSILRDETEVSNSSEED
jgi:hypothetical protein